MYPCEFRLQMNGTGFTILDYLQLLTFSNRKVPWISPLTTILDKKYETNLSFYKKMNCFYTCPFPPHSMLTKLHRDVSLSFNIYIRGERGLQYSYSESELRIHEFYLNFVVVSIYFVQDCSTSTTFRMKTIAWPPKSSSGLWSPKSLTLDPLLVLICFLLVVMCNGHRAAM